MTLNKEGLVLKTGGHGDSEQRWTGFKRQEDTVTLNKEGLVLKTGGHGGSEQRWSGVKDRRTRWLLTKMDWF